MTNKKTKQVPQRRIVQAITLYQTKKGKADKDGSALGILAFAHTIVNKMKVKGNVVRTQKNGLVVFKENHQDPTDEKKRWDNFGFADEIDEKDWQQDILEQYEIEAK